MISALSATFRFRGDGCRYGKVPDARRLAQEPDPSLARNETRKGGDVSTAFREQSGRKSAAEAEPPSWKRAVVRFLSTASWPFVRPFFCVPMKAGDAGCDCEAPASPVADLGPWEDEGYRNRPVAAIACHQPITPNGPKDIFGKEISHDLIGRRHARGLIGTGPRSPRRGAPCTCMTTDKILVAFDLETLQDLPDREQLEDAGLGAAQACAIATSRDIWRVGQPTNSDVFDPAVER